jgi:hypothetical protein
MANITLHAVLDAIDAAIPPLGSPPKVTGPALNSVLHDLATLAAAGASAPPATTTTTYEEVIHFPGQPLFQDTVFEPSRLLAVTASAGVLKLAVCVGDPATAPFQEVPTAGPLAQPLALPVGPLTYQLTFAPGTSYAAIKQVIQIQ